MRMKQRQFLGGKFGPASCLFLTIAAPWSCGREPGIIVNIAAWPAGVERLRVRPSLNGIVDTDIFVNRDQSRFAVRLPVGSEGTVSLDAAGLDKDVCKLATGSLSEPVPSNLSRFIEKTLELVPLSAPICRLATAVNYPVGTDPSSVTVGDFNRDQKLDLAVANSNSVSVLLGNGSGGFGSPANFPKNVGSGPVLAVDLNHDQKLDLVVCNYTSNNVSVFLGDGLGGFSTATNFPAGTLPEYLAVADFNLDQHLDLAVANNVATNSLSVLLGDGTGKFGNASSFSSGPASTWVAVGDFNTDQRPDIAVANANGNNVGVLLGNGMGNFGSPRTFPVGASPRPGVVAAVSYTHLTLPTNREG